jgi:hypothetical protein
MKVAFITNVSAITINGLEISLDDLVMKNIGTAASRPAK